MRIKRFLKLYLLVVWETFRYPNYTSIIDGETCAVRRIRGRGLEVVDAK